VRMGREGLEPVVLARSGAAILLSLVDGGCHTDANVVGGHLENYHGVTLQRRSRDCVRRGLRARELLLCASDAKGSNLLYSLGQEQRFYFRWWTVDATQKHLWREDIKKTHDETRRAAGAAGVSTLPIARPAATVVTKAKADEILGRLIAHVKLTKPDFDLGCDPSHQVVGSEGGHEAE
jgi:hypothetical protein